MYLVLSFNARGIGAIISTVINKEHLIEPFKQFREAKPFDFCVVDDFFEADGRIIIADIGHYESEVFTKQLVCDFLNEKFTNIAVRLSEVNTNPIKYS